MTEILWSAADAIDAVGGRLINGNTWNATGLAMDSRTVKAGDLFIAIIPDTKGNKYRTGGQDGHDFVKSAFANGAVAAIVSKEVNCEIPQIIVQDTFKALNDLGQYARCRAAVDPAIAITGSVGKTGTRDIVDTAFVGAGLKTHASIKSYNNSIGVPFTLASMPATTEVGIFEVGMNYANEIAPLSKLIKPKISIITTIADVHIENFNNDINGIVQAKSEIFLGMASNGVAILPRDSEHYQSLLINANAANVKNVYSFGEHVEADARLTKYKLSAYGTEITANILGENVSYTLQIAGKHIALNSLSALLAVKIEDLNLCKAAMALEKIKPIEGRGSREAIRSSKDDTPIIMIDESYNASPVAMKAAFGVMGMVEPGHGGRRIAILGDMLELGDRSKQMHEDLAVSLLAAGADLIFCSGQHMKSLYEKLPAKMQGGYRNTSVELAEIIPKALIPGDVVLIKGSFGSKMKIIVDAIRAMNFD